MPTIMASYQAKTDPSLSHAQKQEEMNKMMVCNAKMEDKLFNELDIETEQLNAAIQALGDA